MNVAVVNPKNKEVKKVARFDTYADGESYWNNSNLTNMAARYF